MNPENKLTSQNNPTRNSVESAIFAALIALGALITIPLGPVPISLQNFFVFMAGLVLKPKQALVFPPSSMPFWAWWAYPSLPVFPEDPSRSCPLPLVLSWALSPWPT